VRRSAESLDVLYVGMLPPHPGGSAISWAQILACLSAQGHAVRALAPITEREQVAGDAFAVARPELEVHRYVVPHHYTGPNMPASPAYQAREAEQIESRGTLLLRQRRPDVVISGRETFALHVPALARKHRLPCLQGIRGNTAIALIEGTSPPDLAAEMLARLRDADALVAVAQHLADGLAQLGVPGIRVIRNAVDLDMFAPRPAAPALRQELGIERDSITVVHASNLKAAKRPLDLVHAAELALRREPGLIFLVVGEGALRADIETLAEARGIRSRFRFVGWVDYARMPDVLALADLVVSTSQSEGMSRIYLEAQASGCALVASDIPASRELIRDGETGLLFPVGDAGALADRILHAAALPERRRRLGAGARACLTDHTFAGTVTKYVQVLHACRRATAHAAS
jgi:glycosyltransferase involved in cell wall biosynthesis